MATQTHLPLHWRLRLLDVLDCPRSDENLRFLQAWAQAEGVTGSSLSQRNPLNTTYPLPWGSSDFNDSHVKNYSTPLEGIAATALTLDQATFAPIVNSLKAGTATAEQIVTSCWEQIRTWGTNPQVILDVLKTM